MSKFVEVKPNYFVNVDNIFSIFVQYNKIIGKYYITIQSNDSLLFTEIGSFETEEEAIDTLKTILEAM